jgi:hypothetical protein
MIKAKKQTEYIEYPYLEEMNDIEYEKIKREKNWIVCDPGKRVLLYMKSKKGKCLRYTNKEHIKKTKRRKYNFLIKNYKEKNGISKIEKSLTSYNSKSCVYETFKAYVKEKNKINKKLLKEYENNVFRKYKWYGYINRKKAETDLIRKIKKKFGKKVTMIYGDWSIGQQMKHMISTPNISLKRKISEQIKVYNIDEYKTSCISSKTMEKTENMYLPDNTGVIRKMHSILTYKMSNKRKGCINRDNNAVNNMIKIMFQHLKDRTRPEEFKRGTTTTAIKTTKDSNPEFMPSSIIRMY